MPNAFRFLYPFLIALLVVYLIHSSAAVNKAVWPQKPATESPRSSFDFIVNYKDDPQLEEQLLRDDSAKRCIFLLGSSELVNNSDAVPYRFITKNFNTHVKAIGHAGNQCFSMLCQLLANTERLPNARIVFIISPGWFESKNAAGTSSEVFLEYNSDRFLQKVLNLDEHNTFKMYACRRIADLYPEFNAPSLPIKLLNFKGCASRSPLHKLAFAPLIAVDNFLLKRRQGLLPEEARGRSSKSESDKFVQLKSITWDSLLQQSRLKALQSSTNNELGINNAYYTEYIHGRTGSVDPVPFSCNQEFRDFKMLVRLVQAYHVQATFLISPLNPLYYKNLASLSPTMDSVRGTIRKSGFQYLDLFVTDASKYEKASLTDIMHMGDYGWYLCDRFIIDQYKLGNER